jgi:hypothetical protein
MSDAVEVKPVSYKLEGTKLVVSVDANKDGQPVLVLQLDMLEAFDEVGGLFKPKA